MNVIVSKLAPTTKAPRIRSGSTSAPSNLPAPSSSNAICPTVFRPMRCPEASQGVLGRHPPAPPSPFADHPPETMPSGSWMSVILKSDSAKRCALDAQTPARLVAAGDVGSAAHADTSSATTTAADRCHLQWIDATRMLNSFAPFAADVSISGTIVECGYITILPRPTTNHACPPTRSEGSLCLLVGVH